MNLLGQSSDATKCSYRSGIKDIYGFKDHRLSQVIHGDWIIRSLAVALGLVRRLDCRRTERRKIERAMTRFRRNEQGEVDQLANRAISEARADMLGDNSEHGFD